MALGAHCGAPDGPVWSIVGDGAFFYSARELLTIRDQAGPAPVFFLFNDASWSAIRLGQTFLYGGRHVGTDLQETDYSALVRSYGCLGISARTPAELTEAIDAATDHRGPGPLVVEIKLGRDHVPYAGASFVLAELDGALRSLLPQSLLSTGLGLARGSLPLANLRSLMRVGRK
jgi:thiamine pyrophosphate-dependent acetolactate synthase large subunit-like protein